MKSQIHFAVTFDSNRPLCRDYDDRANWTIQRNVVTCPECLRFLECRQAPARGEPAGRDLGRSANGLQVPGEAGLATHIRAATEAVVGRVVVVIEDDRDNALALAEVLESGGHRVHTALTGRTGIELVRQLRPDVVICDLWLPDTDGYEVARTLRNVVKFAGRLIAFTGVVYQRNRDRAADAGFDVFVAKPADGDALIRAVGAAPSGIQIDAKMV